MQPISAKALLAGLWPAAQAGLAITGVTTDSRAVAPGNLFVAIRGKRADGHDYAPQALAGGAALVLASRPIAGVPPDKTVLVADVLDAMITMGANYRAGYSPLVLAVTGSVGKTTTKEFAAAVFSAFGPTLKTEGNQNNEIGLPNTLFRLDAEVCYAVLEMGMQGAGEIRKLTLAARPSAAVITKIGLAHIEQLGSLEQVLAAKLEVAEGVAAGGPLVLNGDDALLYGTPAPQGLQAVYAGVNNPECEVRAANIRREAHGLVFDILDRQYGRYETFIPAMGRHNVTNALLAYTAATRLGLNAQQSAAALAAFVATGSREKLEVVDGVSLLEDFYNAGPDSMAAALATLAELKTPGRRIAVLGDMLELGAASGEQHKKLGRLAQKAGVDLLVTVGPQAALAAAEAEKRGVQTKRCETCAEAAQVLRGWAKSGDAALLKASRGMRFEEILEKFRAG